MSAADVEVGGRSSPRGGATLAARLQARIHAILARVRDSVARLIEQDDSTLAAWAAAFAKAPQAVPDLPRPPNKRLTRFVIGFVIGAHVAVLAALWWRSSPPPLPPNEITVELVREMPEAAKPKPAPEAKQAPKPPQPPVQEGKSAEQQKPAQQQAKQQQPKSEQHQAKSEQAKPEQKPEPKPKAEPRQPKTPHQRQAHRAPPQEQQQHQQAQAQQRPTPGAEHAQQPETPTAMPAIALPGASEAGTDAVSYQQLVLSQVAKAKKQGRYMGVPGYAGVRFRVAEDGSLESVKLAVSSGDANLDIEAEAMIRRAAPFPKPPPGGRRDYGITLVFAPQP